MDNTVIIAEDKTQFQKEQDQLLKTLLTYRFFNPWRNISSQSDLQSLAPDSNLELYLTNQCNQHCEYCYLHKYPGLYPSDKTDPKNILKNLRILYDYILVNDFHIPTLDVFSGEIWHTDFGIDFFNTTLEYIAKGMKIDQLLIATNAYFVSNNKTLHQIQNIIKVYESFGTHIQFSISIDGKIIDNLGRERNNTTDIYTDDFYERLFAFAKVNNYQFHPMISSSNVKYWKENYQWWIKMLDYYEMNELSDIMMLEVRNPDWTDESIADLCDFILFLSENYLKNFCNNDIKMCADSYAGLHEDSPHPELGGYHPWMLNATNNFQACTVANHLTVRVGDLAICPCHRQAYDKYLYGYFVVQDDHITDIKAVNPQMAVRILMGNVHTTTPVCTNCIYNQYCMHGCFGSQIETQDDPFFPIENVCKMFQAKLRTILQYYRDSGIIDYYKSISKKEFCTEYVNYILELDRLEREANS